MPLVNGFKKASIDQVLALGTLKGMLLDNVHVTDIDADIFIDDVSANEISGTNYSAGGATLSSVTVTQDNTNNKGVLDAADITFSNVTITDARFVAYYVDSGTPGTSPIINIVDFGADESRTAQDLTIQINAGGILDLA